MPFVALSSAFNTISPMKLSGTCHTLSTTHRKWIFDFLTQHTPTVRRSHRLYISTQHRSPPRAVCSAPSCSHIAPMTALQASRELYCEECRWHHRLVHYKLRWAFISERKSSAAWCSVSAISRSWLLIQRDSRDSTLQRTFLKLSLQLFLLFLLSL